MAKAKRIIINDRKLNYSPHIDLNYDERIAPNQLTIKVNKVTANMQDNEADFEAIAFCAKSINNKFEVTLEYKALKEWDIAKNDWIGIYRAFKMKELYPWFKISNDNSDEVDKFGKLYTEALSNNKLRFNLPESDSGIKENNTIKENHLEKWFVLNTHKQSRNKIFDNLHLLKSIQLHDQLPCGLFYGNKIPDDISEKTRIFNTGYFDLWGIYQGEFCLFELKKKGNNKLGVISELFFYSCLVKDYLYILKNNKTDFAKMDDYRGYKDFDKLDFNQEIKIRSYFLVPSFNVFITGYNRDISTRVKIRESNMKQLLKVLNERTDNVQYDCIWFNQDEITAGKEKEFIDGLKEAWDNYRN